MLEVHIRHLQYPHKPLPILRDFGIRMQPGELLCLTGGNGSGKTSVLNLIAGVLAEHGKAFYESVLRCNGEDISDLSLSERHRILSYVMADPDAQVFFPNALKELCFPLENMGITSSDMQVRIENAKRIFGIDNFLERNPATLSAGEKKLLIFAIAEVMDSPLMLFDEPEAGLGKAALETLIAWLYDCRSRGKMIIIASHAPGLYRPDVLVNLHEKVRD